MHNLFRLASRASLEGLFYKPRADRELLAEYAEGLIGTTGCPSGEVQTWLRIGNYEKAGASAAEFRDIFGADNFFLELMDHGLAHRDQGPRRPAAARQGPAAAAGRHQRPALHRRGRRGRARGAALRAVRQDPGRPEPVPVRRPRLLPQVARRDAGAVGRTSTSCAEACDNTLLIAERCSVTFDEIASYMPRFPVPDGGDRADLVRQGGGARAWPPGSPTASRPRCRSRPTTRSASSPR